MGRAGVARSVLTPESLVPSALRALLLVPVVAAACDRPSATIVSRDLSAETPTLLATSEALFEVREIVPDREGAWALGSIDPFLWRYAADGTLDTAFLRQGEGPGEVLNPWSIAPVPERAEQIAVWDVAGRRLLRFGPGGDYRSSTPLRLEGASVRGDIRSIVHADPHRLRAVPDGYVVQVPLATVTQPVDLFRTALLRLDTAGVIRDTLIRFERLRPERLRSEVSTLVEVPVWDACPDGEIVVYAPDSARLVRIGRAGARHERLDLPLRPLSDEDRRRYLRWVVGEEMRAQGNTAEVPEALIEQVLGRAQARFPAEAPRVVDLHCADDGSVWLNEFSTVDHPLGYSRSWRVYSGEGPVASVRLPATFRLRRITGDRLWGTTVDADDVQALATLPRPTF